MKKAIALFAFSFILVSAGYAQTGTRRTDTTTSHKMMKKGMNNRKKNMDSAGNGYMSPMQNDGRRADSSNSGNGIITPNQNPNMPSTPVQPTMPNQPTTPTQPTTPGTPGTTPTPVPNK